MKEQPLADYFVIRWDKDQKQYFFVEHWGIAKNEVKARLEKLAQKWGKKNLAVVTNLSIISRDEAKDVLRQMYKKAGLMK